MTPRCSSGPRRGATSCSACGRPSCMGKTGDEAQRLCARGRQGRFRGGRPRGRGAQGRRRSGRQGRCRDRPHEDGRTAGGRQGASCSTKPEPPETGAADGRFHDLHDQNGFATPGEIWQMRALTGGAAPPDEGRSRRGPLPRGLPMSDALSTLLSDPRLADGRWRDRDQPVQHGAGVGRGAGVVERRQARQYPRALPRRGRGRQRPLPDQLLRRQRRAAEAARRRRTGCASSTASPPNSAARSPTPPGRTVVVAGSMGPTGEIMAPMGSLTHERAVEMFHEQAEGLKEGGADVLWVETISAAEEYKAAAEAARLAGMPWCGTMSFDTAGRTMMGLTSAGHGRRWSSKLRQPAAGLRRQLRRRRVGPAAHGAGLRRPGHRTADHRQGQRRASRNTTTAISTTTARPALMAEYAVLARDCGRDDHRRLLRHHARASARHARGAGDAAARAAPDAGDRSPRRWARSPRPRTAPATTRPPRVSAAAAARLKRRRRGSALPARRYPRTAEGEAGAETPTGMPCQRAKAS